MKIIRSCLLAAAVALAGTVSTQVPAMAENPATPAATEAPKAKASGTVRTWTRARLDAAKKRWAEDNAKFTDCSKQLEEQKKIKKLPLRVQGQFLQDCMARKP